MVFIMKLISRIFSKKEKKEKKVGFLVLYEKRGYHIVILNRVLNNYSFNVSHLLKAISATTLALNGNCNKDFFLLDIKHYENKEVDK